jgi:hypothetical protein
MRLVLGGKTVEIIHPGLNHSDDASIMYFPAERVVFATEFLADALVTTSMRSLPSACGAFDGSPMSEWIRSYAVVEGLDFDVLAPGHGSVFKKADVIDGCDGSSKAISRPRRCSWARTAASARTRTGTRRRSGCSRRPDERRGRR